MNLPIVWKQDKSEWCVYDSAGNELLSTKKYSDAAAFAEDYAKQHAASQTVAQALQVAAVRD